MYDIPELRHRVSGEDIPEITHGPLATLDHHHSDYIEILENRSCNTTTKNLNNSRCDISRVTGSPELRSRIVNHYLGQNIGQKLSLAAESDLSIHKHMDSGYAYQAAWSSPSEMLLFYRIEPEGPNPNILATTITIPAEPHSHDGIAITTPVRTRPHPNYEVWDYDVCPFSGRLVLFTVDSEGLQAARVLVFLRMKWTR